MTLLAGPTPAPTSTSPQRRRTTRSRAVAESYWVNPGELVAIELAPGDVATVTDVHGRQPAELTLFDTSGDKSTPVSGLRPDGPARMLQTLASKTGSFCDAVIAPLVARGLRPLEAQAVQLFGYNGNAGARLNFRADRTLTAVLGVPRHHMAPEHQDAPCPVLLEVRRNREERPGASAHDVEHPVPAPLAEPILDIRIDPSTAISFEVPAGCFVQVIDVEGRQSSDFLAFDARRLHDGIEHGLDLTATRSMNGSAVPTPGLQGKFFGPDLQPLLEVIQDTVGRHDTFSLACTRAYYENLGYPGHVNCTDNFNDALRCFGIGARPSWAGLNLFYNTYLDATARLFFDEPWSRPGDYVLLRALGDLICATSACPDDIDPANGWDPTAMHLRVYAADRAFRTATATRPTPDAPAVLTKQSGFHERTAALSSTLVEQRGYWLPSRYDGYGLETEYWACRERVAVVDLSSLRKFEITGPDAEALLQATLTCDVRRLATGQVSYTALCAKSGGMIDDGMVFRLSRDAFRFIGGDDNDGAWLRDEAARRGLERVWVRPSTDSLHNLAVQGPNSRALLASITWTPLPRPPIDALGWFRFTVGRLGGPSGVPVVVSRTGYTGELGYEVFCHPDDGVAVWDAIWTAGAPMGLAPLGLEALDVLRIESGFALAGSEFDHQVDPFEAGIGFTVPFAHKREDFTGHDALWRRHQNPSRVLVGLRLDGTDTAAPGDGAYVDRLQVGVVTSATRSPLLGSSIALCRMAVEYADIGTVVELTQQHGASRRLSATVVRLPFYDPEKERRRS